MEEYPVTISTESRYLSEVQRQHKDICNANLHYRTREMMHRSAPALIVFAHTTI